MTSTSGPSPSSLHLGFGKRLTKVLTKQAIDSLVLHVAVEQRICFNVFICLCRSSAIRLLFLHQQAWLHDDQPRVIASGLHTYKIPASAPNQRSFSPSHSFCVIATSGATLPLSQHASNVLTLPVPIDGLHPSLPMIYIETLPSHYEIIRPDHLSKAEHDALDTTGWIRASTSSLG